MTRSTHRRIGGKAGFRAFFLTAFCIGLATLFACGPERESSQRYAFTAELLDTLDTAMARLAAGRWPSWTMRIDAGQLAFRIEASADAGKEARRRDCSAIAELIRENAGVRVPWHAEFTRGGRLVERCAAAPVDSRRVG